jgi:hypothetical protein
MIINNYYTPFIFIPISHDSLQIKLRPEILKTSKWYFISMRFRYEPIDINKQGMAWQGNSKIF